MVEDNKDWEDDDKTGTGESGGTGGKSGSLGFRIPTETYRDDLLAPTELNRLLQVHESLHKSSVDKQKLLRKERTALKENRPQQAAQHRAALGGPGGTGGASRYKKHPISSKAQFSGIDKQVTALPTEFESEANRDAQNRLENRHDLRNQPAQRFNPKPRPY